MAAEASIEVAQVLVSILILIDGIVKILAVKQVVVHVGVLLCR